MVVGITRVRDEVDIVEQSIRRMATQVDHIICGENFSQDGTREILDRLAGELPLTVIDDTAKNFEQREVLTGYAQRAREELGATWVVPFDMDELWAADEGRVSDALSELPETVLLAPARLLNHTSTRDDDWDNPDPFTRMVWREVEVLPLPKVAARALPNMWIDHGNHAAHFDGVRRAPSVDGVLGARHFPYRSPEQFIKRVKIAWPMLRDSGLPRSHGQHMWEYGEHLDEFGEEGLRNWFFNGMCPENPSERPNLVFDPVSPLA